MEKDHVEDQEPGSVTILRRHADAIKFISKSPKFRNNLRIMRNSSFINIYKSFFILAVALSGGFRDCGARGRKHMRNPCLKIQTFF